MKTQLIIKGAFYFSSDRILVAHYSGMFFCVDCSDFRTKKAIKQNYSKANANRIIKENMSIKYDGETYIETGDSSNYDCDDMILLSDLSELSFAEQNFDF